VLCGELWEMLVKPYRTLLFIPGNRERMLEKGPTSGADALLPDLEDGVPIDEKDGARAILRGYITTESDLPIFVRVNSLVSGETRHDLEAVVVTGLWGVFLPKTQSADEVRQVADWLDELERAAGLTAGRVEIVPMLETALGVLRAYEIASASPRVGSVCFASAENGDLQTDLGCDWSVEGTEMLYARSKVLLDARAAGLEYPLDGVYVDLEAQSGLIADTTLSKRLGYKGRTVIHPKQVGPVNRIYTPSAEEVAYYQRLLAAFEAATADGKATAAFEGRMIDYAMAARARRVLALAEMIRATDEGRKTKDERR
jgi:citrate lyase subunit beta/citryl-CoA lyase